MKYFGKAGIEGATTKAGARIHDVVSMQMRANRHAKKNLTSRFWDNIILDFGLKSVCVTDQLPGADVDECVCQRMSSRSWGRRTATTLRSGRQSR